jgi:beta-lactam-binding protein with PASTA domain
MWEQVGNLVTVPDVVGLNFGDAQMLAREHGVVIANPDPDGTPIGAVAWRRVVYITDQNPAAGSIVTRHASLAVELADGDAGDHAAIPDPHAPRTDAGLATPEREQFIDLTDGRDGP